ncbi:STAS domain-containing protein [Peribacillus psychrosaccharolyticus]|uniref:STAS domain-containing protein n=1 Tax=Peribacillus psychrosaccharolyticus TaxID=1407 RepID=A0A974NQ27_PERPY|nr:STAS domain-containing protein [Peribacillus psychrosaccharolyticus]MEC2057440.1 STAS domain-containing protein [Peribacillus psychrosaccharolyticus]MED3745895.1 STAS domain-containing protein [Peribacillus psychrosaccharolyticus]QQT01833.1 STAS domain-containing protein [Peribacillus psychrosaccharolyticus]
MKLVYEKDYGVKEFINKNKDIFKEKLLSEAVNVRSKIEEILLIGNIDLLNNANKLTVYIVEEREEELISFAKQEGVVWATHALTLSFKLEWVHAIRRTIWDFFFHYNNFTNQSQEVKEFFNLEKKINDQIDTFLNTFIVSYSDYKDKLIRRQKEMVEDLSVPIIPITPTVCILPLIGSIDSFRTQIIEEKVLIEIGRLRIQTLIMDLSGIAKMEANVIDNLMKIIDGTSMMGCKTTITGLRPEIVREVINLGLSFDKNVETKGTLQQALKDYLIID